jgi:hypothetical protein
MTQFKRLTLCAIAAPALLAAAAAWSATDVPRQSCIGIKWNPAFLAQYPKAPVTCQEVTVKDGVKYAKFNGKVSKVDDQMVEVQIFDVGAIPVSMIAFEVGQGGLITVGDKTETVKDLRLGDKLTFWVREGEFGVSPTLTDRPIPLITPKAMPTP